MNIAVIGVNYSTTPIEIREKVSFTTSQKKKALQFLRDKGINEVVIISTCNRSEIYICCHGIEDSIKVVEEFYKEFFNIECLDKYLFVKKHREALNHIYNVTIGLDSMILCEDQILGQVKDALQFSMKNKYSGKILNKLFREAITTAKKIKATLKISENPISLVYIAIKYLKNQLGDLKNKKICIIGTGDMGLLALNYLIEEDVNNIYIANRTYENIKDIIEKFHNIKPVFFKDRYSIIPNMDIIITATSAPHTVINYKELYNADINKDIYIMDLALPRDVEKEVAKIKNIHLFDIDDFNIISEKNKYKREQLSIKAKDIIDESVEKFLSWKEETKVDAIIEALNKRNIEIKNAYLNCIERKLKLKEKDQKVLEHFISAALKKVIREPIINLKKEKDKDKINNYIENLKNLFEL